MSEVKTIVLVHGFWTDASSYSQVISALLTEGYEVIAVQNPLTSLADDVAAAKRALARIEGKCLLVGHSWGGTVITEAGNERVSGLVYIAALAPEAGESMIDLMSKYVAPSQYFQEQAGFVWISKAGVQKILAGDLTAAQSALMHATQTPPSTSLLQAKVDSPAWKNKPSWYIVANQDQSVPPELQRDMSKRMGAKTIVVESSHVAMLFQAQEVLDVIREATANSSPSSLA